MSTYINSTLFKIRILLKVSIWCSDTNIVVRYFYYGLIKRISYNNATVLTYFPSFFFFFTPGIELTALQLQADTASVPSYIPSYIFPAILALYFFDGNRKQFLSLFNQGGGDTLLCVWKKPDAISWS